MKAVSEILSLLRSTTAQSFSERYPDQDVLILEPYQKHHNYDGSIPPHAAARMMFLPRAVNKPVPVGRDSRSVVLLDHPAVSRLHLVLAYTAQGWKVMDKSSNGAWMNGQRMPKQAVSLPYGTPVRMGRALVLRLFPPDQFHDFARGVSQTGDSGRKPASDRHAETDRWPAVGDRQAPTVRIQPGTDRHPNVFGQPAGPAPVVPATPAPVMPVLPTPAPAAASDSDDPFEITVEFDAPAIPPAAPSPAFAPAPPPSVPPAPPPSSLPSDDDIDFEFDFDMDGRGGFA